MVEGLPKGVVVLRRLLLPLHYLHLLVVLVLELLLVGASLLRQGLARGQI